MRFKIKNFGFKIEKDHNDETKFYIKVFDYGDNIFSESFSDSNYILKLHSSHKNFSLILNSRQKLYDILVPDIILNRLACKFHFY